MKNGQPENQFCTHSGPPDIIDKCEMRNVACLSSDWSESGMCFIRTYLFQCPNCKEVRVVRTEKHV